MTVLAGIGFTTPWLLLGLLALPVLWLILRAIPPAPIRRLFPAVTLLLGLQDDESVSDRTPWWLLLLRMLAVAAIIIGLAGPVLNPSRDQSGSGPLLLVLDASWAGATGWPDTQEQIDRQLTEAGRAGRPVAILQLTAPEPPVFQSAEALRTRLPGLQPQPWQPSEPQLATAMTVLAELDVGYDTHWFSDGLAYDGNDTLLQALRAQGEVTVYQSGRTRVGLRPARFEDGLVRLGAVRSSAAGDREVLVLAHGKDPAGIARVLATATAAFSDGEFVSDAEFALPSELRARVSRFELQGQRSAGAVTLVDDALRRREIALIAGREDREGLELLSPLHYLEQALAPTADLLNGALLDLLPANPDVVVLADIATLSDAETAALTEWIEAGGMLLRFSGPRLAASDISRREEHPLMPVRLRSGGRAVGGAMSWGEPKALAPFPDGSPFAGLSLPDDVRVTAQVMAQPDPTLAERVVASLSDGTPLVTRKDLGQGQVVLFHVTANAEWSTLPLSGLFVEMLERLAVSSATQRPDADDLEGTTWRPEQVMDGYGTLREAGNLPGVDGPALAEAPVGPSLLPGLYSNEDRRLARNVLTASDTLSPTVWPADVPIESLALREEFPLGGILLSLA
ncbi:MAG: BatA domain-containing protein, partial [Pseudomonadota bacterium]